MLITQYHKPPSSQSHTRPLFDTNLQAHRPESIQSRSLPRTNSIQLPYPYPLPQSQQQAMDRHDRLPGVQHLLNRSSPPTSSRQTESPSINSRTKASDLPVRPAPPHRTALPLEDLLCHDEPVPVRSTSTSTSTRSYTTSPPVSSHSHSHGSNGQSPFYSPAATHHSASIPQLPSLPARSSSYTSIASIASLQRQSTTPDYYSPLSPATTRGTSLDTTSSARPHLRQHSTSSSSSTTTTSALAAPPTTIVAQPQSSTPSVGTATATGPPTSQPVTQRNIPGVGLSWVYSDGSHIRMEIDGEKVNPAWGVTKAGKPRKRLATACLACREKKIKCDYLDECCVQCEKAGRVCKVASGRASRRTT